jgi:glutamate synthase (ferredoxin)
VDRNRTMSWPQARTERATTRSLYDPRFEHDACGVGFVARAAGRPDHEILTMALEAVSRLSHRGAVAADGLSGDGAGVLTQIPRRLLLEEAEREGWALAEDGLLGVGMLFLPADAAAAEAVLAESLEDQHLRVVGWRTVPVDPEALGDRARASLPRIRQVLVQPAEAMADELFERLLYLARKRFERESPGGYVCSLSGRTVVYKALCAARQLPRFYLDLADSRYETTLALFHQRYSTNTLPSWPLAQPLRMAAHNGEVNTLWGNRRWMRARACDLPPEVKPVLNPRGSDSTSLDEALELLTRGGRSVEHAMGMLVVPAWEETDRFPPELMAFYRYHAPIVEPWDGPAALTFTDGRVVGAALDRNGLRPCRYKATADGLVVAGSEVGLFDLDPDVVVESGRLGPGQMLLVDVDGGDILRDTALKQRLAESGPFARWLGSRPLLVERGGARTVDPPDSRLHQLFGVTAEDLKFVLSPMAEHGKQATWSMGDDTPVPPLARSPRPLYAFLRQRFAQVTNPPIDPLRESEVMSLRTWLGPRPELLLHGPQDPVFEMPSPVATPDAMRELRRQHELEQAELECVLDGSASSLPAALDGLCEAAASAVRDGASLLILTDRSAMAENPPSPMALALGAVHHHLVEAGLRSRAGIVVETGDCWDVHHLAVLVGYGAGAVCPWLALATARAIEPEEGEDRVVAALEVGLRKVMSKMGISAVASYRGAQLFEALGLAPEVVDRCFRGTPNRLGGIGWREIEGMLAERAAVGESLVPDGKLPDYGLIRFRRDQERHAWSPYAARALQKAVATGRYSDSEPDDAAWEEFLSLAGGDGPSNLRDLLAAVPAGPAIPESEVESAASIARRFVTAAMSLGALSPEAHRTLTAAMNRLGARSNTGEGGEDPAWWAPGPDGERLDGKIKQIASGRFGVTAEYIVRAEELEIKMAQGSKPGEGGQLPGHKVTALIARLRHAQPGISLISPPPHHDIYSIEDLAQLIYDLKRCNPTARVGVKLVAEAGVGTIAAGVAKAYADYVVISGHAGGTGASPLSSIKHAGSPWELGLAEAQQVLIRNGLRSRVRLRTDGGLMTGGDVVMAALLGADEFGFGTAPLVAMGCDMARQCHLNSCPTGIATQRPDLRAKFRGDPDHVVRYFLRIAEEARGRLAALGLRTIEEAVGRVDLLRQAGDAGRLDLGPILVRETADAPRCLADRNDRPEETEPLEDGILREAAEAIESGAPFTASHRIRNSDRSVGARIGGAIAARHGSAGLPDGTVVLKLEGSAGQSFGAFGPPGLRLRLTGEANDYVGKGLCGADIVLRPLGLARQAPQTHVILGNVALYGATSGRLFAAGAAGERFAVRNSGAVAVVEGVGDHGCEYMTGGTVVVLAGTGYNFGAGMTGGTAYVLDDGTLAARVHEEFVECGTPGPGELETLRRLMEEHVEWTGSVHAAGLLADWERTAARFRRVAPLTRPAAAKVAGPAEGALAPGAEAAERREA